MVLAVLIAVGFASPTFAAGNATVYVVHGIAGSDLKLDPTLPVDITVNGACAIKGLVFKQIVGPISLPAGNYSFTVRLANKANPCSNPVVIYAGAGLGAGDNVSLVAHLSATGIPRVTPFYNDVARPVAGATLSFRHAAAAPEVTVIGKNAATGFQVAVGVLSNSDKADRAVPPGTYDVTVSPSYVRPRVTVLGPAAIPVSGITAVYVVGSVSTGSLTAIVQTITP